MPCDGIPARLAGWGNGHRPPAAPARRARPRPRRRHGVLGLAGPSRRRLRGRHPGGVDGPRHRGRGGRRGRGGPGRRRPRALAPHAARDRRGPGGLDAVGAGPRRGRYRHPARGRARGRHRAAGAAGGPVDTGPRGGQADAGRGHLRGAGGPADGLAPPRRAPRRAGGRPRHDRGDARRDPRAARAPRRARGRGGSSGSKAQLYQVRSRRVVGRRAT